MTKIRNFENCDTATIASDKPKQPRRKYQWSLWPLIHSLPARETERLLGEPEPTALPPGPLKVETLHRRCRTKKKLWAKEDQDFLDAESEQLSPTELSQLMRAGVAALIADVRARALFGVVEERIVEDQVVDGKLVKGKPGRWTARATIGKRKFRAGGFASREEAARALRKFRERGAYKWNETQWMSAAWCDAPGWDKFRILGLCSSEQEAKLRSAEFLEQWRAEREEEYQRFLAEEKDD